MQYQPIVKGGQGRSARSVRESSSALLTMLVLGGIAVVLLAIWGSK